MDSLVAANLKQRPTRTLMSILGVALGVALVVLNAGLVNGSQQERGRRESSVGAEIMFCREFNPTSASSLSLPIQYADRLAQFKGVALVSPVGQHLKSSNTGIGFEFIDGVDYASYAKMSGLNILQGRRLEGEFDVIVDETYARNNRVKVGDAISLLERQFTVAGIYGPERGPRIKINLTTLQKLLATPDACTLIYLKCVNPQDADAVARDINEALPDNKIIFLRDLPNFFAKGLPALNTFLRLVVGLSVVVSLLVIMLTMYTTITERTREIGILKSLGASKTFIVSAIEREALIICVFGILLGFVMSFALQFAIVRFTALIVEIELKWMLYAAGIGVVSGLLGALYPAMRAASQDPVKALSYE
jgi:putative ABC transport system permease protein